MTDALSRLTRLVNRANFEHLGSNKPVILNMCKRAASRGTLGQFMREDPLVSGMAEAGSLDPEYIQMCNLVESRVRGAEVPQDSELKQIEGLREELRVVQMDSGARLLVRGEEVYIPKSERAHLVGVLHMGHQSADTMVRQCKGRIFWPGMRKSLNDCYETCEACSLWRVSRMSPKVEVNYNDLFENFFPGQCLELDYLTYNGEDFLSVVDVLTGYVSCFKTRNKTSDECLRCMREWMSRWGRPFVCKTDYGPGFRDSCREGMAKLGIKLIHASSYNPRSMGLAERSVRSVKGLLRKNSRLSQLELDELLFAINTTQQGKNMGSSLERFLGRSINTALPNSLAKGFSFEDAIKERAAVREKRWNKPEKGTKLIYEVGEIVKLQHPKTKMWDEEGTIQAVRTALDGQILSYDILLPSGGVTVRHRKYLRKTTQGVLTNTYAEDGSADHGLMNVGQNLMNESTGGMESSRGASRQLSVGAEAGQLPRLRPRHRI